MTLYLSQRLVVTVVCHWVWHSDCHWVCHYCAAVACRLLSSLSVLLIVTMTLVMNWPLHGDRCTCPGRQRSLSVQNGRSEALNEPRVAPETGLQG